MRKVRNILLTGLILCVFQAEAQYVLSLEDCRRMAIESSKSYKIKQEEAEIAKNLKKAAFTQYLPNINAAGSYFRNSDDIALLSEDKFSPVGTLMADGTFGFTADQINNQWAMINGQAVPLDANGQPFNPKDHPEKIQWKNYAYLPKSEFTIDNKNVFVGGVSLMQPVFLGGKIRALNRIAKSGENLAAAQQDEEFSEIICQVDVVYWQIVSISNRLKVAEKYRDLLEHLVSDIEAMKAEGLATQSDLLSVKVKYNEADLNVIKAENGLSLSKMLLCQKIGLASDQDISLADEEVSLTAFEMLKPEDVDLEQIYENRPEIRQLKELSKISKSTENIARSRFYPNLGLTANYLYTNPNPFNGFENEFKGSWNVGLALTIPITHFGERFYTLNAAKAESRIAQYTMDGAKEKIELQVHQSEYKMNEASKKFLMMERNYAASEENLRTAELAFKEGVVGTSILLEAQTAWQMAFSERIDAMIDMKLCRVYLQKAMGTLK